MSEPLRGTYVCLVMHNGEVVARAHLEVFDYDKALEAVKANLPNLNVQSFAVQLMLLLEGWGKRSLDAEMKQLSVGYSLCFDDRPNNPALLKDHD